jgi:signal transduction histidine kinase
MPDKAKSISFRPKARIMRTLGQELISSEVVAVIELVKNAYDADATQVLIRFSGDLTADNGCIEVIDNGHGMTLHVVERAWMEPATGFKRDRKFSPSKKRKLLGEKGVGRFAASRLAKELTLITKTEDEAEEVYALFDWEQFDVESQYLDEILMLMETRPAQEISRANLSSVFGFEASDMGNHGTILRMQRLYREWDREDFLKLRKGLSRLVSPFSNLDDFSIMLSLPEPFNDLSREISPPDIIRHPHYSIKGNIETDGRYQLDVEIEESGLKRSLSGFFVRIQNKDALPLEKLSEEEMEKRGQDPYKYPPFKKITTGPFSFEMRIWDRDRHGLSGYSQMTGMGIREIRRELDELAGVNIYRDGFRVLPYGEPHNDWLRLDIRRVQKPTEKLSNNQILGYISISAEENPGFKDQSNREGLYENQSLEDLRDMVIASIEEIEKLRYVQRRSLNNPERDTPVRSLFAAINLNKARAVIASKYPGDQETLDMIDAAQQELTERVEAVQNVISRYQGLATLGTLIDIVLHEGRLPLDRIINQSILGREAIEDVNIEDAFLDKLRKRFETIELQGKNLGQIFNRIEPFAGRKKGKPATVYLENVIRDAVAVFEGEIENLKAKVEVSETETLVRAAPHEIMQVIVNLMDNSLYWLKREPDDGRHIKIVVNRPQENQVTILFSDSGPGIPQEDQDFIFDPYFSNKPDGVGLGLAVSGEIIEDFYNGKLELLDQGPLKGANFLITLNKRV